MEEERGTVRFNTVDLYRLDHSVCLSPSYYMVKEDRVMNQIKQPLDPLHKMVCVAKPGITPLLSNPDFRSFAIVTANPSY